MSHEIDFRYAPPRFKSCIGRVDDPHKTIVREDGSLHYGNDSDFLLDVDADEYERPEHDTYGFRHRLRPVFSHEDELLERTQDYGDPGAAIVTTTEEYVDTTFEWTVFAHAGSGYDDHEAGMPLLGEEVPLRADVIRWSMTASEDFGSAPSAVSLTLDGEAEGLPRIIALDPSEPEDLHETVAHTPDPPLESGQTREGAFVIVLEGGVDPDDVTMAWVDDALGATHEYWAGVELFRNEFRVPDQDVNDMLAACGRNLLQAREVRDGIIEYQVSPTFRRLVIVDNYFMLEAARMMGRGEETFEHGLLALLQRVKSTGAIQDRPTPFGEHYMETGIAMATFVRQCELADDDQRLAELWPTMLRGLDFLEALHQEAWELGPDYPARTLFPPAFFDGGITGPFPEYGTPLWVLAGLRYAANAGERLGLPDYERFERFYEEIWAGFDECAARDRRETAEGITYLPMNMVERDYDNPQSATWAFAHAIYPGEVFDRESDYVQDLLALLDAVDDVQGIPEAAGWIHEQGVWTYSASFYAHVWLYAGHPEKAVDYLYAYANHAAPTRAWDEEQTFRDNHYSGSPGDMPHTWGSAEFIRLVRNLLVFERGETLELLPGLPEEWLPNADDPLVLAETPTRFGSVDLRLERADDGFVLQYQCGEGNREPTATRLHWGGDVVESSVPVEEADGTWKLADGVRMAKLVLEK